MSSPCNGDDKKTLQSRFFLSLCICRIPTRSVLMVDNKGLPKYTMGTSTTDAHGALALPNDALRAVGMLDFFENDRRPIFVVDLQDLSPGRKVLQPVFYNVALMTYKDLYATVSAEFTPDTFQSTIGTPGTPFTQWASKVHNQQSLAYSPTTFSNLAWDVITVKSRWNVVSANISTRFHKSSVVQTQAASRKSKSESHSSSSNPSLLQSQVNTSAVDNSTKPSTVPRRGSETSDLKAPLQLATTESKNDDDSIRSALNPGAPSSDQMSENHLYQATINVPASHYTKLVTDLQDQTQLAIKNARLLDRVSSFESVGIYMVDSEGDIDFCNETWYRLTRHPKSVASALAWMDIWHEEDLPRINQIWQDVMLDFKAIHFEGRFNTPWKPPFHVDGEPDTYPTWIRAYSYPEVSEDGVFLGASGCLIDISEQKWVERMQARKMDEALEHTRLLEALNKKQTEAATIQLEAAASEIRFRRLADLMPMSIFMADSEQLIYANEAYHVLFAGVESKQAAESWISAVHADDLQTARESWNKLIEDKLPVTFEARLTQCQDCKSEHDCSLKSQKWVLVSAYAEVNSNGSLQHIVGCVTDISSLKEAEQIQMQRLFDVTQAKNQQEAFIDMTSHEIRNPLSSIVHCADEISDHLNGMTLTLDKRRTISVEEHNGARVAAQTILFCTEHLKRIVDDVLTLSKINSNVLHITPTAVQPKSSALQALNMFDREMRTSAIEVDFQVDESVPGLGVDWAYLDQLRVLQILVNLVGNSVKFTQQQELRQLHISVHASRAVPLGDDSEGLSYLDRILPPSETVLAIAPHERIYIKYTVQDTGCGISAEGQKVLFSRFTQESSKTHVKYGGNGLGLFISRQLCELHGGQMGFKSVEGQGSTFAFFIMTKRTTPVSSPVLRHSTGSPKSISTNASTNTINIALMTKNNTTSETNTPEYAMLDAPKVHVLLVEDNMINQRVLSQQLKKRGYIVDIANHGEEALAHIQTTHFWTSNGGAGKELAVVLLDNEMPVMNGLTCVRKIREFQADGSIRGHIPVVAVTANARPQQVEEALAAGMDHVVSKPFRMPELVSLITKII